MGSAMGEQLVVPWALPSSHKASCHVGGHADPGFLFHARELSDLEDALSPSSLAFLTASLPCAPILLLGLICLEGKNLVSFGVATSSIRPQLSQCHGVKIVLTTTSRGKLVHRPDFSTMHHFLLLRVVQGRLRHLMVCACIDVLGQTCFSQ